MTTQDFDIESAGEPAPTVDYTGSGRVRRLGMYLMAGGFGFLVGWSLVVIASRAVGS